MNIQQIEIDRKWIHQDFDMDEEKLSREAQDYAPLMEEQARRLFNNFMSLVASA